MSANKLIASICLLPLFCFAQPRRAMIQPLASASAAFAPTDIAGMQFWFSTNNWAGGTGSNCNVWLSSDPNHMTRVATNDNPVVSRWPMLTNAFGPKTGVTAMYFDATGQNSYKILNALDYSSNIASASLFAVLHCKDDGNSKTIWHASRGTTNNSPRHILTFNTTEKLRCGGRTLDTEATPTYITNNTITTSPIILQVDYLHDIGACVIYTNGTMAASNGTWTAASNTSATNSVGVFLGSLDMTTDYFYGWIAEIGGYVPAISAANRASLTTWIDTKYQTNGVSIFKP